VRGTIQEELEAELKELLTIKMKRLGMSPDNEYLRQQYKMKDIWEMKSRVVQGGQMILPIPEDNTSSD
jgi:hypothetical protein